MILLTSNTACDHLFSQINNIKTDTRNKFKNEHVVAILHVKQAVKEQDGCINLTPSDNIKYRNHRKLEVINWFVLYVNEYFLIIFLDFYSYYIRTNYDFIH